MRQLFNAFRHHQISAVMFLSLTTWALYLAAQEAKMEKPPIVRIEDLETHVSDLQKQVDELLHELRSVPQPARVPEVGDQH